MPKTAVLVLASYNTHDPAPIKAALEASTALDPLLIHLVADETGPSPVAAKLAFEATDDPRVVYTLVRAFETGFRWGEGVRATLRLLAARGSKCDRFIMLPGDIDKKAMEETCPGSFERLKAELKKLLACVDDHDLAIGGYDIPADTIKDEFDEIFTIPLLAAAFPDEWEQNIKPLNINPLRSEFWAAKLDEKWSRLLAAFPWPRDPTPALILRTIQEGGSIGVHHLGQFQDEDEGRYGHLNKAAQGIRLGADLAVQRANYVRRVRGGRKSASKQAEEAKNLSLRLQRKRPVSSV